MPTGTTQNRDGELDQEQLRQALDRMVAAFNQFHGEMRQLEKQQQTVIEQIRRRIDQKKIEEIHSLLKQANQQ